jgi:hypothetical protein
MAEQPREEEMEMTWNIKATGIACIAMLALGALGAQVASANVLHHFQVGIVDNNITATGDPTEAVQKFFSKPGGAAIECKQVHLEGTQGTEKATALELTPTAYTECTSAGFPVTVTDEGCKFVFHAETSEDKTTTEEEKHLVENAAADLNCGGTGNITLTVPVIGCTIKYSDRNGAEPVNQSLHGVHYVNTETEGESETITAEAHVHGIHYVSAGCGLAGIANGTHATGILKGKTTVKAYEPGQEHIAANQINATNITT